MKKVLACLVLASMSMNVFASRGSAIHLFIKQIRDNESVTITNKKDTITYQLDSLFNNK